MAVVLRSLSDFKRFLTKPGATIQIVRNTFVDRQPEAFQQAYRDKGMYEPRTVQALSKKAAVFAVKGHPTTVWLYWDKGTRKWRYANDTVSLPLDTALGPPDEITYRCSFATGYEPTTRLGVHRTPRKPSAGRDQRPAVSPPKPALPTLSQGRLF